MMYNHRYYYIRAIQDAIRKMKKDFYWEQKLKMERYIEEISRTICGAPGKSGIEVHHSKYHR